MLTPARRPFVVWMLINIGLLIGVPTWAFFALQREVEAGHRDGTITSNGDSISIPLMGIIMGVAIVALVFNIVWLACYLWLRWRNPSKRAV